MKNVVFIPGGDTTLEAVRNTLINGTGGFSILIARECSSSKISDLVENDRKGGFSKRQFDVSEVQTCVSFGNTGAEVKKGVLHEVAASTTENVLFVMEHWQCVIALAALKRAWGAVPKKNDRLSCQVNESSFEGIAAA